MTFKEKIARAKKLIKENYTDKNKSIFAFSGGKDSAVLIDLANKTLGKVPMLVVLSNTEFTETYDYCMKMLKKYGKKELDKLEFFVNGDDPADCCRSKKVNVFKRLLEDQDVWFSGIRKDEGVTRGNFEEVEIKDGLKKVNPILDFTEKDVWRYIALFKVPVNPVYERGYRSLSCKNCSVVEQDENESERAGRWKDTEHEGCECGIHTESLRDEKIKEDI